MLIRFFCRCAALAATSFLLLTPALQAQDMPSGVAPRADTTAPKDNSEPGDTRLPLESVAPYSTWKHHTAQKPEEALVRVRCTPAGGGPETVATGLVVRCDGFILVPLRVSELARSGGSLVVTLSAIDGALSNSSEKTKGAVTVAARIQPRANRTVPFALIKTNGCHYPSLPLLDSANAAVGKPVRILWLESGAEDIRAQAGVIGPAGRSKETFTLSTPAAPAVPIPAGAIVVDGESGAALGMVTEGGAQPVFTTFAHFYFISSEVGLAPDRAAVRLGDSIGSLPSGVDGMVWVPGGPVALDGQVAADFVRDYGTSTVCTPGLWMAIQPVTNGQYAAWMRAANRPLPIGWTDQDRVTSLRRPDRPVCGMILEEATLFAAANHARLPTEVEWRRAAYIRPGESDWVKDRIAETTQELSEIRKLYVSEGSILFFETAEANRAAYAARGLGPDGLPLGYRTGREKPQKVLVPVTPELAQIATDIHRLVTEYQKNQWEWGQVGQIDAFRQDRSVFGVRNVIINAPEIVQSRLHELIYAPKPFPATVDPDLTQFTWTGTNIAENPLSFTRGPDGEDLSFVGTVRRAFREINLFYALHFGSHQSGIVFYEGNDPITIAVKANLQTSIYAGFRCAR